MWVIQEETPKKLPSHLFFSLCFLQFHRNIIYSMIILTSITLWMGPDGYPLYSWSQHLFMSNEDSPLSVCSPFPESLVCYIYYPETLALLKEYKEKSMSVHLSGNGSVFPGIFCLDSGLVRFLHHTIICMLYHGPKKLWQILLVIISINWNSLVGNIATSRLWIFPHLFCPPWRRKLHSHSSHASYFQPLSLLLRR